MSRVIIRVRFRNTAGVGLLLWLGFKLGFELELGLGLGLGY